MNDTLRSAMEEWLAQLADCDGHCDCMGHDDLLIMQIEAALLAAPGSTAATPTDHGPA